MKAHNHRLLETIKTALYSVDLRGWGNLKTKGSRAAPEDINALLCFVCCHHLWAKISAK